VALTFSVIAIGAIGALLWQGPGPDAGRWMFFLVGFPGGFLYCVVQVRAALRRMQTRDRQEP
jgi:hypothetical protein